MPSNPDITSYLKAVPTDDQTKAQAWEVYNNPANQQDFEQRISKLNLPQQAKADMWEAKWGNGNLNNPPVQSAPKATPGLTPPAAVPAPEHKGLLSRAWDWANTTPNIGGLKEYLDSETKYANSDLSAKEMADPQNAHLYGNAVASRAVAGWGADVAKTFLTPLSAVLSVAGGVGEAANAMSKVAKTAQAAKALKAASVATKVAQYGVEAGFAGHSAVDLAKNGLSQNPNESREDWARRVSGDAMAVVLPAVSHAGGAAVAKYSKSRPQVANIATPSPESTGVSSNNAGTAPIDPQTRIQQAVGGGPKVDSSQTIHVDPDFAAEMQTWNNNAEIPNKRVILKTNKKSGNQTVHLASSDPSSPGQFSYTNTEAHNGYSTDPVEGQVPVQLGQTNGNRSTKAPGHFLSNEIGDPIAEGPVAPPQETPQAPAQPAQPAPAMPFAAPETVASAPAELSPVLPQPEVPPTALEPTTRMYHGGSAGQSFGDEGSLWATSNLADAQSWARQASSENPQVYYADHPTSKINSLADPDEGTQVPANGFGSRMNLPFDKSTAPQPLPGNGPNELGVKPVPPTPQPTIEQANVVPASGGVAQVDLPVEKPAVGTIDEAKDQLKAAKKSLVKPISPEDTPLNPAPLAANDVAPPAKPTKASKSAAGIALQNSAYQDAVEQFYKPGATVKGYGNISDQVQSFQRDPADPNRWSVSVKQVNPDGTLGPLRTHSTAPDPKLNPEFKNVAKAALDKRMADAKAAKVKPVTGAGGVRPGVDPDAEQPTADVDGKIREWRQKYDSDPTWHEAAVRHAQRAYDNGGKQDGGHIPTREELGDAYMDSWKANGEPKQMLGDMASDFGSATGEQWKNNTGVGLDPKEQAERKALREKKHGPTSNLQAQTPPAPEAEGTAQPAKPSVDVSPIEDRIKPLVGKLLNLKRLRRGEAISHTIDKAIDATHSMDGSIDADTATKVGKLLNEPVGSNLTADQMSKLEALRGAKVSGEPQVIPLSATENAKRMASAPEAHQAALDRSMVDMVQALQDPNIDPKLQARIMRALEPGRDGETKPVLFNKSTVDYPEPTTLADDHPERSFSDTTLGHDVTPINTENLKAIFKGTFKDSLRLDSNKDRYVSPEERAEYNQLRDGENNPAVSQGEEDSQALLSGEKSANRGDFDTSDLGWTSPEGEESNGGMSIVNPRTATSSEFREFKRDLQQKALQRRIGQMEQELRSKVGEWNSARGQALTPLTEQLSKLGPDARKYLPEELFAHEKPNSPESRTTAEASGDSQSAEAPAPSTPEPAAITAGQKTSTEGIKYTEWDSKLAESHPESVEHFQTLQEAIAKRNPPAARQKLYNRVMQSFHEAVTTNDDFALKQAIDIVAKKFDSTQLNSGVPLEFPRAKAAYTPDEIHSMNAYTSDKLLERWERMSESELLKKQAGLYKDSLTQRIEGAVPTSDDPTIRAQQTETYNELKARHEALTEQVGPSKNLHDSFMEWANNFQKDRPEQRMLREVQGVTRRNNAILRATFDSVDRLMNNLSLPELDRFWDNMERGTAQSDEAFSALDPKTVDKYTKANGAMPDPNELAARLRDVLDAARDRYTQQSGNLEEFITNHMPGLYDNQAKAGRVAREVAANKNFAGTTSFLKQKTYEFRQEALKAGLQPVTSNPVRAAMMQVEQLNHATMAHEYKNRLVDAGVVTWYDRGETPPEGHEPLNDRIFTDRGNGNYYGPVSAARTFNNFVSRGLTGAWKIPYTDFSLFDAIKNSNNLQNMMQLSFSAFHGMETMINSGFSTMAVGIRQTLNEGIGGIKSPTERLAAVGKGVGNFVKGATFVVPLVEDIWNGQKGMVNFNDPAKSLEYGQLSHDLEMANANVRENPHFHLEQIDRMKKNWKAASDDLQPTSVRAMATAKAVGNLMASSVEVSSYPLMTGMIPRVKIGAFYRMAEQIHSEMAGSPPEAINSALQSAWDSVDNRFGELNQNNLFWPRTMKDILGLGIRSIGWTLGTIREIGGGAVDLGKTALDVKNGNGFKVSNRTAYTAAMVSGTMAINAAYQYLHTGEMPKGMDYFFPRDGSKTPQGEANRVYPKTYAYDFINLYHDPQSTIWHKASPEISTISDLLKNEDYYHHQIRDPGNSPLQNAKSVLGYMAHQHTPFSLANLQEAKLRNQTSNWESFAGILPAPRWVGRTNAENLAYDYFKGTQPSGAQDTVTLEKKQEFIKLRNAVQQGTIKPDDIQDAIDHNKISASAVKYLYETKSDSNLQVWTKNLRSESQVWNIWKSASPEEKRILLPTVISKMSSLSSGEAQAKYLQELSDYADKQ